MVAEAVAATTAAGSLQPVQDGGSGPTPVLMVTHNHLAIQLLLLLLERVLHLLPLQSTVPEKTKAGTAAGKLGVSSAIRQRYCVAQLPGTLAGHRQGPVPSVNPADAGEQRPRSQSSTCCRTPALGKKFTGHSQGCLLTPRFSLAAFRLQ